MKLGLLVLLAVSMSLAYVIYNSNNAIVGVDHRETKDHGDVKLNEQDHLYIDKTSSKPEPYKETKEVVVAQLAKNSEKEKTKPNSVKIVEKENSDPYSNISSKRIKALWVNDSGAEPSYKEKWRSIKKIGLNLTPEEKSDVYDFIRNAPNRDAYDLHLKDELMIKLEKQPSGSNDFLNKFIDIAAEESIDGALRGYVMQHIRSAYWDHIEKREYLRNSIYKGLEDHSSDVSGTALMAAVSLNEKFGEFDIEKINDAAIKLSQNYSAHLPSKMTAIKIIGEQGLEKGLDLVRDKAKNGEDTVMKIVAIHSLGDIGTEKDLILMKNMLKDEKLEIMHPALKKSIYKVENRL